jgi:quercetin dioxygenase-like cupin family protein
MKAITLLKDIEFHEKAPNAEPLFVSEEARVLRFALRPGQVVREHHAPHSPVIVTVLQGRGLFAGGDGVEQEYGPNDLLIFPAGENHSIRALNEDLIFTVFLREAPDARSTAYHRVGEKYVG